MKLRIAIVFLALTSAFAATPVVHSNGSTVVDSAGNTIVYVETETAAPRHLRASSALHRRR